LPSIIKVDQIQSDQGFVNLSSNLQFSSGFTMLSPTLSSPTLTTPTTSGVMTLGAGIKFPATQVSSADANTLDDYEEGTWTPVATRDGTAPTISYTSRDASYVKIGSMVYCQMLMNISSISANGSGLNQIEGLPFAARASTRWGGMVSLNTALSSAEAFYILGGDTKGYFWTLSAGNPNANWVAPGQMYVTFVYQTS
jgi:hypothetical protein